MSGEQEKVSENRELDPNKIFAKKVEELKTLVEEGKQNDNVYIKELTKAAEAKLNEVNNSFTDFRLQQNAISDLDSLINRYKLMKQNYGKVEKENVGIKDEEFVKLASKYKVGERYRKLFMRDAKLIRKVADLLNIDISNKPAKQIIEELQKGMIEKNPILKRVLGYNIKKAVDGIHGPNTSMGMKMTTGALDMPIGSESSEKKENEVKEKKELEKPKKEEVEKEYSLDSTKANIDQLISKLSQFGGTINEYGDLDINMKLLSKNLYTRQKESKEGAVKSIRYKLSVENNTAFDDMNVIFWVDPKTGKVKVNFYSSFLNSPKGGMELDVNKLNGDVDEISQYVLKKVFEKYENIAKPEQKERRRVVIKK